MQVISIFVNICNSVFVKCFWCVDDEIVFIHWQSRHEPRRIRLTAVGKITHWHPKSGGIDLLTFERDQTQSMQIFFRIISERQTQSTRAGGNESTLRYDIDTERYTTSTARSSLSYYKLVTGIYLVCFRELFGKKVRYIVVMLCTLTNKILISNQNNTATYADTRPQGGAFNIKTSIRRSSGRLDLSTNKYRND